MPRFALVFGLLAGASAAPQSFTPAQEGQKPSTIAGWGTAIDPSGDCTIHSQDGKVTIEVPAGLHDLWKGQKDMAKRFNAPRVMRTIEGDFVVRVKVTNRSRPGVDLSEIPALERLTGIPGTRPYQGVGLLVWDSDQHYLRLERGAIVHANGRTLTVPWYVRDGARVNDVRVTKEELFKGQSTWLRLERAGQKFTTSISHDGKEWIEKDVLTTELPTRVQVGISAVNVSNYALAAEYEDFKVLKE